MREIHGVILLCHILKPDNNTLNVEVQLLLCYSIIAMKGNIAGLSFSREQRSSAESLCSVAA